MAIDASVYGQIQAPRQQNMLEQFAQVQGIQGAQQQNRLADLMYGEKEREINADKAMAGLLSRGEDVSKGLASQGFGKQSIAYTKAQQDAEKQRGELVDARLKQSRAFLESITTPEQYIAWHEGNHKDPVLGPALAARGVTADQARATITAALSKPGGFEELLKKSALGIEKFTEMNKPTFQTRNTGGTTDTLQLPGLGGAPTVVNSIRNTQSPDSVASTASAAAGRAQSAAQFKVTSDQKERELTSGGKAPAGYRWKANGELEAIPGGPAGKDAGGTEGERNASGYALRMSEAEKLIAKAATADPKSQKPGLIEQVAGNGMIANGSRSSVRQEYRQAQEDWVRAKLRKESGAAIPNDEMEREITVYFPQINDGAGVVAQKAQARQVAETAMKQAAGKAYKEPSNGATGDFSKPAPKAGAVQDGYRYKGGNPSDPKSWEKV